jgi:hypothetical protein
MLFEGLTGATPFDSPQLKVLLDKHIHDPRPPLPDQLRDGRPPSEAMRIVQAALLKRKMDERPSSGTVVATILGAIARGEQPDATALLTMAKLELSGSTRSMPTAPSGEELIPTIPQVVPSEWGAVGSSGDLTAASAAPIPDAETPDPTKTVPNSQSRHALLHAETIPPWSGSTPADPALVRPVLGPTPTPISTSTEGASATSSESKPRPAPRSRVLIWALSTALVLVSAGLVWSLNRSPEGPVATSLPINGLRAISKEPVVVARPAPEAVAPNPAPGEPVTAPITPAPITPAPVAPAPTGAAHPPATKRPIRPAPAAPAPAPAPAPAAVKIVSEPAEAEVVNEQNAVLGKTPLSLNLPGPATLRIRKAGFIERKIQVQPGAEPVVVRLHAQW